MTINKIFKSAALMAATLGAAQPALAAVAAAPATSARDVAIGSKAPAFSTKYCARHERPVSRIMVTSCATRQEWEQRGYELTAR